MFPGRAGPPGWPDIEAIPEDSVHEVGTSEVIARIADLARGPDGAFRIPEHRRAPVRRARAQRRGPPRVGPLWLRIDEDGTFRAFRMPDSFRAMRFEDDRILGIRQGEYDIESAAWLTPPGTR